MTDNPYQPPQSELINQADSSEVPGFYVVSKKKMVILFLTTLGIYQVYWFYRNWRLRKQATGEKIWPLPRAIFCIFFVHSLFRAANDQRNLGPVQLPVWNYGPQATLIVILFIISNVLDRMSTQSIGSPLTDYLSLLLLLPIVACLASAQERINEACGDPLGESNSRFRVANYLWIVLGLLLWVSIGYGLIAPTE